MLAQVTYETTSAGASAAVLIVYGVIALAIIGFQIWFITKILAYDEATYTAAGQNRQLWMILGIVGICCSLWWVIDLIWWFAIKPKLEQAPSGGAGYGGAPPPTYG